MPNPHDIHRKHERLETIAAYRRAGIRSLTKISNDSGIPKSTVGRLLDELDVIYRERAAADIIVAKGEDLDRIDEAIELVMSKIRTGYLPAVDRLCLLLTQRAKILGLDAPTVHKHVFDQVQAQRIADQVGIPVEELLERANRIMELQA